MSRVDLISLARHGLLCLALVFGLSATAFAAPPPAQSEDTSRHRSLTSSDSYMPLPPLTATVQANRRARGLLQIEAGLEVEDTDLRDRIDRLMPRLRNAYVTALSVYTGMYYQYGEVPDADRIAALLQEATDMTLGRDGAEVLIGMIIIHAD
ncbi:MAG: flagellar basal body-associated FliL family protein [Alphaproteobacteria bacterium]|nr:flagellar basal body-associated FliL family protein [Alphaproteobacteria bacterium]